MQHEDPFELVSDNLNHYVLFDNNVFRALKTKPKFCISIEKYFLEKPELQDVFGKPFELHISIQPFWEDFDYCSKAKKIKLTKALKRNQNIENPNKFLEEIYEQLKSELHKNLSKGDFIETLNLSLNIFIMNLLV